MRTCLIKSTGTNWRGGFPGWKHKTVADRRDRQRLTSEINHSEKRVVMARIGYARVSSTDQSFDGQIEQLQAAGCSKIFAEKLSGKSTNGRHELTKAFKALRPGDVLVITKLDRLARSI